MKLKWLYHYLLRLSAHPRAAWMLGAVSFLESSVFPIPPDAFLLPMGLSRPQRAYRYALVTTVTSVLGGLFGYALGYFFYETIGILVVKAYHLESAMQIYQEGFLKWGIWVILVKGLTPIPYKLVTIASGIAQFDLVSFILASVITRGARFFLIAFLLRQFGDQAKKFIEERLTLVLWGFFLLLLVGILAIFVIG